MRGILVRLKKQVTSDTNARKVLLMIKRFGKLKKSKRGSLLIIVVLILALAIIFISSAMMLTQATKGRLYGNAMSSQARLTVTAASEAFLEALEMQEINDDQFDQLLTDTNGHPKVGQHGIGDKIKMVISNVPGMGIADDNCTYLDLYYPSATDKTIVHADFTTVIGDETENVQIRLEVNEDDPVYPGNGFTNQIEVDSSVGVSQLRFSSGIGMYDADKLTGGSPRDNTIFFRDNYFENESSNSLFFADIVVNGKRATHPSDPYTYFCMGQKTAFDGDLIFFDDAYMTTHASNDWGFGGDFYFLGEIDPENPVDDVSDYDYGLVLYKDGGWDKINNNSKFVFSGRSVQSAGARWDHTGADGNDNGKIEQLFKTTPGSFGNSDRAYFVDKNGNTLAVAQVGAHRTYGSGTYNVKNTALSSSDMSNTTLYNQDGSIQKNYSVSDKVKYYQTEYKTGIGTFPTAETLFASVNVGDEPLTTTYPYASTDPKYKKLSSVVTSCPSGGVKALPAGCYLIDTSLECPTMPKSGDPFTIALDGTKEYRFYFKGNMTFNIVNVVFAMYNVSDNTKPPIFVLEENAKVYLGGQSADKQHEDTTNGFVSSGFLSVNRGITSANGLKDYINTKEFNAVGTTGESVAHVKVNGTTPEYWSYKNSANNWGDPIIYSKYYDGINKPNLFIYGVKGNDFRVSFGTILEAYVGIFGGGSFGVSDTKKDNGKIIPIYGRIMASKLSNGAGNNPCGDLCMPYCPQPGNANGVNPVRPAVSKYHVTDVIYYYDNPTVAVPEDT